MQNKCLFFFRKNIFKSLSVTYTNCAYGSSETSPVLEGCAIWTIIGTTIENSVAFLAWFIFEPSKKIIKLSEFGKHGEMRAQF